MTDCNCASVCRLTGLWHTDANGHWPIATHLESCPLFELERFALVSYDGSKMIMPFTDIEDMQQDSDVVYDITEVYLTRDQFENLPESAGF